MICRGECRFDSGRDGFGMDGVGIVVVEYEDIFISLAGWADEFSGLIGEDTACWILNVDEYLIGARGRFGGWWGRNGGYICCCCCKSEGQSRAMEFSSRLDIAAFGMLMAFDCGFGDFSVFGYLLSS